MSQVAQYEKIKKLDKALRHDDVVVVDVVWRRLLLPLKLPDEPNLP